MDELLAAMARLSEDALYELQEQARRRLRELSLRRRQVAFVAIEQDPLLWCMEIRRVVAGASGLETPVLLGEYPTFPRRPRAGGRGLLPRPRRAPAPATRGAAGLRAGHAARPP